MPGTAYRLYFGERPASQEELDRVEEVVVEQEMDMAWEARLRLFLCLDESGRWRHGPETFARPFSRVRLELRIGDGSFVPLIDGVVASFDTALGSQPGRSAVTLMVRDDSVLLDREEETELFENRKDDDIAREVFGRFPQIGPTRIEATSGPELVTVRRGTAIRFLRQLARAHEYHAYILPGEQPGRSIGCFLPDPSAPGDLPPLKLLGGDRNVADLSVAEDTEGPERTRTRTLRLADQQIVSAENDVDDLTLLRSLPAVPEDLWARRQLPPEDNDREDPEPRARAQARRSAYAFRVNGRLVPGCYSRVLAPYKKVSLRAGETPLSGDYLLTKVTHRITPSLYSQEFEAKGDSRSEASASEPRLSALPIF